MDQKEFDSMSALDGLFWARRSGQLAYAMARINGEDITIEDIEQVRKGEAEQFNRFVSAIQQILVDENVCEYATNDDGKIIRSEETGIQALKIKGDGLNYLYAITTIESLFAAAVAAVYQGVVLNVQSDFMRKGLYQVILDSLAFQWSDLETVRETQRAPTGISDLLQALTQPKQ